MTATAEIKKTDAEQGYADHFAAARDDLPGDNWVHIERQTAIRSFAELGLPHRRIEQWKYTDLRQMLKKALTPVGAEPGKLTDKELYSALGGDLHGISSHHLVFVDGAYSEDMSFIVGEEAGFFDFTSLAEELEHPCTSFKKTFGKTNPPRDDAVLALNTAFMRDGAVLNILDDVEIRRPIHLVYITTAKQDEAVTLRNMINIGRGAHVTILESHVHLRSPGAQCNSATEISIGEGAKVSHIKFQHEGAEAAHLSNWMIDVGKNANYRGFQFTIGAKLSRNSINLAINGEGASVDMSGVALLWDEQHSDTTMNIVHAVPNTNSRETFKTVLDDRARSVFQGKLVVKPDAQKTDAKQMANGLMLSNDCEFDAKPELEIYADDVVCGHGATSGQLDDELMFYMRQRGMDEETAQTLLILAFIGEAFELIEHEEIRAAFMSSATAWLGGKNNE